MKKLFFVLFILSIAIFGLAAQGKATISFYTPAWGEEFLRPTAARYMAQYPNVEVKIIAGPATWQDHAGRSQLWMNTKYSGVDLEYQDDVFTVDGAAYGVWENLEPYMSQAQKDDLISIQNQYQKMMGGIYRIPWWQGMSYNYYNKKIFKDSGLSIPKTWTELISTGQKLTKDLNGDGQIDQWGYATQGPATEMHINFMEALWQAGGDDWTFFKNGKPDPKARQALEFMKELYEKAAPKGLAALGYDEGRAMIGQGKVAIYRDWGDEGLIAAKNNLQDVVGVMNFPAGPAGPWGMAHCWGTVVNKYGDGFKKNKKAVIDFALFQMKPEIHEISAVLGAPALKSVYADSAYMAARAKVYICAPVDEEYAKWRKIRRFPVKHSNEYHEGLGKIVVTYAFGTSSVENTLKDMQTQIDSLTGQ